MPDPFSLLLGFAIILLAAAVQGAAAFGFAVVAVPLLLLMMPATDAVITCLILGLWLNLLMIRDEQRHIDWQEIKTLIPASAVGAAAGVLLLKNLNGPAFKTALPAVFLFLSVMMMIPHRRAKTSSRPGSESVPAGNSGQSCVKAPGGRTPEENARSRTSEVRRGLFAPGTQPLGFAAGRGRITHRDRLLRHVAGASSGLLMGSTSMGGPPVVLYLTGRRLAKGTLRGTLALFFAIGNLFALGSFLVAGMITGEMAVRALLLIAAVAPGFFIGRQLASRLDNNSFRRLVLIAMIAMAAAEICLNLA